MAQDKPFSRSWAQHRRTGSAGTSACRAGSAASLILDLRRWCLGVTPTSSRTSSSRNRKCQSPAALRRSTTCTRPSWTSPSAAARWCPSEMQFKRDSGEGHLRVSRHRFQSASWRDPITNSFSSEPEPRIKLDSAGLSKTSIFFYQERASFYQVVACAVVRHSQDARLDAVPQRTRGLHLHPRSDVVPTRRPESRNRCLLWELQLIAKKNPLI